MKTAREIAFYVYDGPNLEVPFASVTAEFAVLFTEKIATSSALRIVSEIFPQELRPRFELTEANIDLPNLAILLAAAFHNQRGPFDLPAQQIPGDGKACRIAVGSIDAETARAALTAGIETANAVFTRASGAVVNSARLQALARHVEELTRAQMPDKVMRLLMRVAQRRDIPVCSVVSGSKIWMLGQGAEGFRFLRTISHVESAVGVRLSQDKVLSNRLLYQFGYPVAGFGIADSPANAREIARKLGFPVVTKPIDLQQGLGITTGLASDSELDAAFEAARAVSRTGLVMVQRHVHGDNHRFYVFGGKLARATQLNPAHVVGDGKSTIAELIKAENDSRTPAEFEAGFVLYLIELDSAMIALIARQGFGLGDRPPAGTRVLLKSTSNLATAGRMRDVTSAVHPDNVALAEGITRAFTLETAGIDFITTDIATSWREGECAVIEVNSPTGITSEFVAEKVLIKKFPSGQNGRIPCILIIDGNEALASSVAETFAASGLCVGKTDGKTTHLGSEQRHPGEADLPTRIMSLLLDPACQALIVSCTVAEIERHGIPNTRYDLALLAADAEIPKPIRDLLDEHVSRLVENVTASELAPDLLSNLAAWAGKGRRALA